MRAKFTIEPSDNDGVGSWVRPIDAGEATYWKWYQDTWHAVDDAHSLGLGAIEIIPSDDPRVPTVRHSLPIEIDIDPEKLELWRFKKHEV